MKQRIPKNKGLWILMVAFLLVQNYNSFAQTYYPRANGNWGAGATWSTTSCTGSAGITIPSTTANDVSISCGSSRTTTVTSTVSAGALSISSGTLVVNSGVTLTVTSLSMTGGTLTVNGTLNITVGGTGVVSITGGTLNGTGTIGLSGGAQNLTSTQPFYNLNIAGAGNKTMTSNITVTNQLQLTSNNLIVGNNTLTVGSATTGNGITRTNGKLTLAAGSSLSFGGSWNNTDLSPFISNSWPVTINNFTMTRNLCKVGLGTAHNLTVAGSFTLTAGDFSIGNSTLTLNGAISGNINGSIIGGSTSDLTIGGLGSSNMYFDLTNTNAGGSNTIRNFTNNRTSNPFIMLSSMRIGGVLSQATNAKLQISNGLFQTLAIDGTVSGTSKLIGNAAALLHINGSGSMGGTLIFDSTPQLSNLTMNRSGGTATIGSAFSVGGMSFNNGVLTNNALTTVTGGASNSVTQALSSSYLNGAMARTINANTNSGAFLFPVGKSSPQKVVLNNPVTNGGASVVMQVEAFDGDSNGTTDGTISNLKTDNYWSAIITSNPSSLTAVGSIALSDTGLVATDAVGYATTANGVYTSLGGTVAIGAVESTLTVPVAMGYYNIGTGVAVCTDPTLATIGASSTVNCGTTATTLSIASGSLNSAENWHWYTESCGGTSVGEGTSISVSPAVTTTYFVRGEGGCITAGSCASITITVNTPQLWYLDADGDTYGNPNVSQNACSQPLGYVANATDCDDSNTNIYQNGTFYIDNDGDGYTVGEATVCYGATTPIGYAVTTSGTDCDDANNTIWRTGNFFVDFDNDSYTSGATADVCYGATTPSGYTTVNIGIDCDDQIAAVNPGTQEILYNGVDDNCDGNLDEGFQITTSLLTSVCNTTLTSIGSVIGITTLAPAAAYTGWRVRATNGAQVQTIERNVPFFSMTDFASYAYATTYTISIELQRNGVWLGYFGATCQVSTPAILAEGGAATVSPLQCGITLPKINTLIATTSIAGVTGYRFRVTNLTDPVGPFPVQIVDRAINWFTLQMLTRYNYGTTYRIEVAVKTTGTYGGFGTPCEVSSPTAPSLLNCGGTVATMNSNVAATSVPGATQYRFQIVRDADAAGATIDRSTNYFTFSAVPAVTFTPNALYYVRVAVMTSGTWSAFGDVCEITSPAAIGKPAIVVDADMYVDLKATASPNPFAADFGIQINTTSTQDLQVKVFDMIGRLMESKAVTSSELESMKIGSEYPSGVYNVIVNQGGFTKTLRVIKR